MKIYLSVLLIVVILSTACGGGTEPSPIAAPVNLEATVEVKPVLTAVPAIVPTTVAYPTPVPPPTVTATYQPSRPTPTFSPTATFVLPTRTPTPTFIPSPTFTPIPTPTPRPTPTPTPDPKANPPVLKNLLLDNFGPYDSHTETSGVFHFNRAYFLDGPQQVVGPILDFGRVGYKSSQPDLISGNIEFRVSSDKLVYAPIDGIVEKIGWHSSGGEHADWDDWGISIKPLADRRPPSPLGNAPPPNTWLVEIDHVVSLDCPRPRVMPEICDSPLMLDGEEIKPGREIKAGQILGYVGNLADYGKTGLNGRVEIQINRTTDDWWVTEGYCPILFLDKDVSSIWTVAIENYMSDYETWADNAEIYDEDNMVVPGCHYSNVTYDQSTGKKYSSQEWVK